jgi:hypothetical protein
MTPGTEEGVRQELWSARDDRPTNLQRSLQPQNHPPNPASESSPNPPIRTRMADADSRTAM